MSNAQIISVTTANIGPAGPIKKLFAVAVDDREVALEAVYKRLKPAESAKWLEARRLSLSPGEVRQI